MADSTTRIASPVEIESDSKYRVAFDLMKKIAEAENSKDTGREYYLELFYHCMRAVNGHRPRPKEA